MSVFTQATNALQSLQTQWSALQEEIAEQVEILVDLEQQQQHGEIDLDVLVSMEEQSSSTSGKLTPFSASLGPLVTQLGKFHAKAQDGINNPDQQIYGAAMVSKIQAAHTAVQALVADHDPIAKTFNDLHASLLQSIAKARVAAEAKAQAEAQAAAEAAAKAAAAKAEADRVAAEAAKAAAEQAAAQAAAEALEKQRAAEEAARVAQAAAEARAAEERATRETMLAERRAAEAAAASQASAAADAAQSSKPLLERSLDSLRAALAELKSSSTPEEHQVALQTLLKFLSNVVANPRDEKFRHIRSANEIFQRRLGARPGGLAALRSIGFEPMTTPATLPAGSELQPNTEYYRIDARAELWPVLVESRKVIEQTMRASGAPAAATAATPAAAAPSATPAGPTPGAFPGFPGGFPFFPPPAAAGGAPPAAASPFAGLDPFTMMSDPFVQQLMSNPALLQSMMGPTPNPGAIMGELMRNPALMSSMMQSPMLARMMSNPQQMQQMMAMRAAMAGGGGGGAPAGFGAFGAPPSPSAAAANPFVSPFGAAPNPSGAAPPANPMAAWLNMMRGAPAAAAAPAPAPAATTAAAPQSTPTAAPSAAPTATPAAAPSQSVPMEDDIDEDALLAEAIAMSMQSAPAQPQEKKE